jgi:hypothetical protein
VSKDLWLLVAACAVFVLAGCAGPQRPAAPADSAHPCLLADSGDIAKAREWLKKYDWYREIYEAKKKEVDAFVSRPIYVSPAKYQWTYQSYECEIDKSALAFDYYKPFEHTCPKCGKVYKGGKYDAHWAGRCNHFVSDKLMWLGIVYQITGGEKYARAGREILLRFAELYLKYPNENNSLGPARMFCGTLDEAIFGQRVAMGYDMIFNSAVFSVDDHRAIREKFLQPLAELIQLFPETTSNRQTVYNTAIASIGFLYGDKRLIDIAVDGKYGMKYQLRVALSRDGLWPEGPRYHQFTLSFLVMFAEVARHNGYDFYKMELAGHCLKAMFDAPLDLANPAGQFPQIRDTAGGMKLASMANLYEAAWARYGDPRYALVLNYLRKNDGVKRAPYIFFAVNPELPDVPGEIYMEKSRNFEQTGIGVLRDTAEGDRKYVYLDYGIVGGEHGHQDRLGMGYYACGREWLVDPGTEAYYQENLQTWYRQTIAHNTLTVNESKMTWANGRLNFFGENPGLKVASGGSDKLYGGAKVNRTIVMVGDYFLDIVDAEASETRTYDLPYHSFGKLAVEGVPLEKQPLDIFGHKPGIGGYDQFTDVLKGDTDGAWSATFRRDDGTGMALFSLGCEGTSVYSAMTPGIPGAYDVRLPLVMVRRRAEKTHFETLLEAFKGAPRVTKFFVGDSTYVVDVGDERHYITIDVPGSRYSVVRETGKQVMQFSAFNMDVVTVHGYVLVKADFALDSVDVKYSGDTVEVTVPEDFGRLRIHAPVAKKVLVNGKESEFATEGDSVVVTQARKGLVVRLLEPRDRRVFLGMDDNKVILGLYNYSSDAMQSQVRLRLRDGWREDIQTQLDYWGGIVNLVGRNKTDPWTVDYPRRPAEFASDYWVSGCPAKDVRVAPGESCIVDYYLQPDDVTVDPGAYDVLSVFGVTHQAAAPFTLTVAEPLTVDVVLPNGKPDAMAIVLTNNTPSEKWADIRLVDWGREWSFGGEGNVVFLAPGETVLQEVSATLKGYDTMEQVYPIQLEVECAPFSNVTTRVTRSRKDLYVGICHEAEKPPSLDGTFDGWDRSTPMTIDKQNQVCHLLFGTQPWGGKDDLSAKVYAMYDKENIYIGCEVTDNVVVEHYDPRMRWPSDADCVEVVLDTRTNSEQGKDPPTPGAFRHLATAEYREIRFDLSSYMADIPTIYRQIPGAKSYYKRTDKGYNMIVVIPLSSVPLVKAEDGCKVGFDVCISDNDGTLIRRNMLIWAGYNQNQNWLDLRLIGALVFRKK